MGHRQPAEVPAEGRRVRRGAGLENHWGLGRDAVGVLRVIDAIKSPWLRATLDTGNFLENQYEQYAQLAPHAVLIQAKTYHGGGKWYTLEIDYPRVAKILREANYSAMCRSK